MTRRPTTPNRAAASRANGRAGGRPPKRRVSGERWAVVLRVPTHERAGILAAADRAGQRVGEWLAQAARERLAREEA